MGQTWEDGWVLSHQGGGCSAWQRWFPGGYVLISDGDGCAPSIEGYRPRPSLDEDVPMHDAFIEALVTLEVEVCVSLFVATEDGDWAWVEDATPTGLVTLREALRIADTATEQYRRVGEIRARRFRTSETGEVFGLDGLDEAVAEQLVALAVGESWVDLGAGPAPVTITRVQ